jgi:hypothetical protein
MEELAAAVEALPEPVKVSPFAELVVDETIRLHQSETSLAEITGALTCIEMESCDAKIGLLRLIADTSDKARHTALKRLVSLTAQCQRAAEDLGLIARE